jgi:hypothetical protein
MNIIKKNNIILFHTGGLQSDIDRLRTCHRCHEIFPVLSDLFNHTCDNEDDLLSSKSTTPTTKSNIDKLSDNKPTTDNTPLFNKIPSISPKSFILHRPLSFKNSSIPSSRIPKLISPLSSPLKRTSSISIRLSPVNDINNNQSPIETEHIPHLKRPLFQSDITTS